ncbi:MAG: M23 family metallopeptidase [Clostridia bacterium]|nr:M23 family metallopeptidase [Clostridia bacterium]
MKFIFNRRIKYYTKETIKWVKLIAIALLIIMAMIFVKYKMAYQVTLNGEQIGYIANQKDLENTIQKMLNHKEENVAFVDIEVLPKYQLMLVNHDTTFNEEEVVAKVKETSKVTYKLYAVTLDGEEKSIVNSLEEAEQVVTDMKEKYEEKVQFTIGIHEVYTETPENYETVSIKVAETEVSEKLQAIEDASVNGVYLAQKPISGIITSRFGSRESIRSYAHTGLDIAAPYGTDIKAAATGTVKWAGDKGSYGNLVIVDCGNGVEIYYGHCSKLYVTKGQTVTAGDVIAAVGSTGHSTGNHLHFEIRVNGSQVNPQNYIYH